MNDTEAERPTDAFIVVPPTELSSEALHGLLVEFVTRDGTDYGAQELTLKEKIARLRKQVLANEVLIVFHAPTEQVNLVRAEDVPAAKRRNADAD